MKNLIIIALLLLLGACREEEGIWDKLTDAEKRALELRASLKCIDDEQKDIDDIISFSNNTMQDAVRLQTWEISSSDSTPVVNKIHVWKKTATHVYFLYLQSDSSDDVSKFIKIPLAQNIDQIRDLQRKKCATLVTSTASTSKYKSASLSSSTFVGNYEEARVTVDDKNYSIQTQTFTYNRDFPAFFGILQKTRVKKTYTTATDVVNKTDTYKMTIKRVANATSLNEDFTTFTKPHFCVVKFSPAEVGPPAKEMFFPIPAIGVALFCDQDPAKADANGDGISDFAASDLAGPF